jgi:hypothetical protein
VVDTKMTKTVGEHWTCAYLARAGWAPALTRDGVARTDVLAVATNGDYRPTIEVQVKAANQTGKRTSWMVNAKAQLAAQSEHECFVFVLIPGALTDPIRGFIVPRDHVTAAAWLVHQHWLTDPDAKLGTRNTPLASARVND